MKPEMTTLIQYRVDRARESIEEAKLLLENGHLHSSVNRLYYACFYAVSEKGGTAPDYFLPACGPEKPVQLPISPAGK